MFTRYQIIEQILRHTYGEMPNDDSNITTNLVNQWVNEGIGLAVKQHYKDNLQIDGINYINNSFYTTFKNLIITKDQDFIYVLTLPQIPFALGKNDGINTVQFVNTSTGSVSVTGIIINQNQVSYFQQMQMINNKIICWPEGQFLFCYTTLPLDSYKANVRMVSGGDSTNVNSTLNVPDDYVSVIVEYVSKMLMQERTAPKDFQSDGRDII
jgi:hypothetical protein